MLNSYWENLRNKGGNRLLVSPYFFVLAVIFSVTFGLLFVGSFKNYKSDISVLIIPKNESASSQTDQIVENLMDITHRLSFYDRVLFDNPEIQDPLIGLSKDERKAGWNKSFLIERLPGSTTLNISVFNADKNEANKIARQMTLSLSEVASRFYNIQTELDFRIIEGPISSSYVRAWQWLVALSILSGSVLAYLFLQLFNIFSNKVEKRAVQSFAKKDYFSLPAGGLKLFSRENKKTIVPQVSVKKAVAPANLPIAEDVIEEETEILPTLEAPVLENTGEPTDEEYRERLNKLLRGEI
jgi:capsular polysaccharide biosynthesis protein